MPYWVVPDLAALTADLERACQAGAKKALDMRATNAVEVKKDGSIVTAADRALERDLRELFARITPDTPVWGEEEGYEPPNEHGLWMVDPVDGTSNYAYGQPLWGTTAALFHQGKVRLGVIVIPELGWSLTGIDGQGAYCNGVRLTNARPGKIEPHELVGVGNLDHDHDGYPGKLRHLGSFVVEAGIFLRGGMRALITNGVRFYDAAAGIVMAREVGAEIREMDGSQWRDDEWTRDVRCRTFGFFPPQSEWPFQSQ